jgi:hypothetical protein
MSTIHPSKKKKLDISIQTFTYTSETMDFLKQLEKHYGFKAEVFQAVGCETKADYDKKVGHISRMKHEEASTTTWIRSGPCTLVC